MATEQASPAAAVAKVMTLPVEQRIRLAQDLWDTVAADPSNVPVLNWQLQEIRRRKAEADADPSSLLSEEEFWSQVDGE